MQYLHADSVSSWGMCNAFATKVFAKAPTKTSVNGKRVAHLWAGARAWLHRALILQTNRPASAKQVANGSNGRRAKCRAPRHGSGVVPHGSERRRQRMLRAKRRHMRDSM